MWWKIINKNTITHFLFLIPNTFRPLPVHLQKTYVPVHTDMIQGDTLSTEVTPPCISSPSIYLIQITVVWFIQPACLYKVQNDVNVGGCEKLNAHLRPLSLFCWQFCSWRVDALVPGVNAEGLTRWCSHCSELRHGDAAFNGGSSTENRSFKISC